MTKVTPDSDHYFATDEIAVLQAGAYSVEIPTSAVSNGTEYNGYAPGTITTLVDLIPYIESVTNITATAGGDDGEPTPRKATTGCASASDWRRRPGLRPGRNKLTSTGP